MIYNIDKRKSSFNYFRKHINYVSTAIPYPDEFFISHREDSLDDYLQIIKRKLFRAAG